MCGNGVGPLSVPPYGGITSARRIDADGTRARLEAAWKIGSQATPASCELVFDGGGVP